VTKHVAQLFTSTARPTNNPNDVGGSGHFSSCFTITNAPNNKNLY